MILDMLQGVEIKAPKISEITVVRYYEEIVIRNDEWDQRSSCRYRVKLATEATPC